MMTIEERYQSDPVFHHLVDTMQVFIQEHQITPSELREAALLAAIKYELRNTRTYIPPQEMLDRLQQTERQRIKGE
jgi:hypothetical protein